MQQPRVNANPLSGNQRMRLSRVKAKLKRGEPAFITCCHFNEHTLLIAQLESPNALDQAAAIARVRGIDVLMLGSGDLSVVAGIPYQMEQIQERYAPLGFTFENRIATEAARLESPS